MLDEALLSIGKSLGFITKPELQDAFTARTVRHPELVGDGKTDDTAALQAILNAFGEVILDSGRTYRIEGQITMTPGSAIRSSGTGRAFLRLINSKPSQCFFILANGVFLQNLEFDCSDDPVAGEKGGTGTLLFAMDSRNIVMHRVTVTGSSGDFPTCINASQNCFCMWNCENAKLTDCVFQNSAGNAYGLEIIGGKNNIFQRCEFLENGADGVKVMSSNAFGLCENAFFFGCQSSRNGRAVSPQTAESHAWNDEIIGKKVLLDVFTDGIQKCVMPAAEAHKGKSVVFCYVDALHPGAIASNTGEVILSTNEFSPKDGRLAARFTSDGTTWKKDWWTNGEGWDISGVGHVFDSCIAEGNLGPGFQVKPTNVGKYSGARNITFSNCRSNGNVNGFGVVSAGSGIETSAIHFTNCVAEKNLSNGLICSPMVNEKIRSVFVSGLTCNRNDTGVCLAPGCSDFFMAGVHLESNRNCSFVVMDGDRISATGIYATGVFGNGVKFASMGLYAARQNGSNRISGHFENHINDTYFADATGARLQNEKIPNGFSITS